MKLTIAELFAGVGGFRVGFNKITEIDQEGRAIENGDWDFVWANQYEPSTKIQHAFDCYCQRFGSEHHSNIDINKVDKQSIPDHNLLVGGFPCQDYSIARSLSNEAGIEGKKGVLFWDIRDVLLAKKPSFLLLENVDRLLKSPSTRRGRDFAIMLKTFSDLGYDVQWRVLNAADYSMPQKRKRVFIFAYKSNLKYAKELVSQAINSLEETPWAEASLTGASPTGASLNNLFSEFFAQEVTPEASDFTHTEVEQNLTKLGRELLSLSIFNQCFPIKSISPRQVHYLNLHKYQDVIEVSNQFSQGKFFDAGVMIKGMVFQAKEIKPIIEPKFPLAHIIAQARKTHESHDSHNSHDSHDSINSEVNLDTYAEFIVTSDKLEKWRYLKGAKSIERTSSSGHVYTYSEGTMAFPDKLDEPARTLLTSEGSVNRSSHIIFDERLGKYRTLTPIECEMIQMFPANWTNSGMTRTKRNFMMGNALVTGIISRLEPRLREIISTEPELEQE